LAQERQQGLGHGLGSETVELAGQVKGHLALCCGDSVTRHLDILLSKKVSLLQYETKHSMSRDKGVTKASSSDFPFAPTGELC
jgi:hypothetical protein